MQVYQTKFAYQTKSGDKKKKKLNKKSKSQLSQSSTRWLNRQKKDKYAKMARDDGLPSRAIYKLEQIDNIALLKRKKYEKKAKQTKSSYSNTIINQDILLDVKYKRSGGLFMKGDSVIELGAAPGGWSIYASEKIGHDGCLVAIDLLNIESSAIQTISNNAQFLFLQGDFTNLLMKRMIVDNFYDMIQLHHSQQSPVSNSIFTKDNIYTRNRAQMNEKKIFAIKSYFEQNNDANEPLCDEAMIHIFKSLYCRADIIMSDMAANFTGDQRTDALRTLSLCEDALMFAIGKSCFYNLDDNKDRKSDIKGVMSQTLLNDFSSKSWKDYGLLQVGGTFLCKFFSCGDDNERDLKQTLSAHFDRVDIIKPSASRKESAEQYLLGSGFKGNPFIVDSLSFLRSTA